MDVAWACMIGLFSLMTLKLTHLTYGQGVFIVDSLVKHKCNKICGARSYGHHYQKSHYKDVVLIANQNHKTTCNAFCRSNKPLYSNGPLNTFV